MKISLKYPTFTELEIITSK